MGIFHEKDKTEYTPEEKAVIDEYNKRILKEEESFRKGVAKAWKILLAVFAALVSLYFILYASSGAFKEYIESNFDASLLLGIMPWIIPVFIVAFVLFCFYMRSLAKTRYITQNKVPVMPEMYERFLSLKKAADFYIFVEEQKKQVYSDRHNYAEINIKDEYTPEEKILIDEFNARAIRTEESFRKGAVTAWKVMLYSFIGIVALYFTVSGINSALCLSPELAEENMSAAVSLFLGYLPMFIPVGMAALLLLIMYTFSLARTWPVTKKGFSYLLFAYSRSWSVFETKCLLIFEQKQREREYLKRHYNEKAPKEAPGKKTHKRYFTDKKAKRDLIFSILLLALGACFVFGSSYLMSFGGYRGYAGQGNYILCEYAYPEYDSYRISADGDIYVIAEYNGTRGVNIYSSDGSYKYSLDGAFPYEDSVLFDDDGNVYLNCPDYERYDMYNASGEFVTWVKYEDRLLEAEAFAPQKEQTFNGKTYISCDDGIYICGENGTRTAVITIPLWYTASAILFWLSVFVLAAGGVFLTLAFTKQIRSKK